MSVPLPAKFEATITFPFFPHQFSQIRSASCGRSTQQSLDPFWYFLGGQLALPKN